LKIKALVIDCNRVACEYIKSSIKRFDIECDISLNAEDAYQLYNTKSYNILFVDILLPNMSGIEFIEKIRVLNSKILICIIAEYSISKYFTKLINLNISEYILKPITKRKIDLALNQSISKILIAENIHFGDDYIYSYGEKCIYKNGKREHLTHFEITLVELILTHKDKILTYDLIERSLYNGETSRNSIKLLMCRIRRKLSIVNIKAIRDIGYQIKW